jgi:DNA (cytosine-5)-methyltransferase 1
MLIGIDLFSGCGGLSLGAKLAGFAVKAAVERDRHACATYRKNLISSKHPLANLIEEDILNFSPRELMRRANISTGELDILLGGPPCQGFSTHRLRDSGVNDPRNALLIQYFEFVSALRPAAFLVENVPGLMWERHEKWLLRFRKLAEQANYHLREPVVLNAKDFGVPQNRKRVFLFGHDRRFPWDFNWVPSATHGDPKSLLVREGRLQAWTPSRVAFTRAPKGDPNDRHMRHNDELVEAFKRTPKNGGLRFLSGRTLPCHRLHDGHFDVYGRVDPRLPAPTMTTACINPSKGRFVHPTQPHGITIRQAARLQSFPDWFTFDGGLMAAGVQIGNAVPPLLAKVLLEKIAQGLNLGISLRSRAA